MTTIIQREATPNEQARAQDWELWESGNTDRFEYIYDQDVQFIVQQGAAVIHSQYNEPVAVKAGDHVTIRKGVQGIWDISSPIVNRYQYL
ncbi:cupin domain-containing protein [Pseudomonas sp. NPDC089996]|uniref:cupin domain-containing protein n=1 Tax=Pseudomonas sp. NPDC089996 TaxID=3364474 RepID=UPI00380342AB